VSGQAQGDAGNGDVARRDLGRDRLERGTQLVFFRRIEHMAGGARSPAPRHFPPLPVAQHVAAGRAPDIEAQMQAGAQRGTPSAMNMRVISRGLVIMVPTTTAWAPASKPRRTRAGV